MLHLGLVKPQIRDNTAAYWSLVKSVAVITTLDTLVLGTISFLLNLFLGKALVSQFFIFLCVPVVACMLAVGVSVPLTSLIAIETYKRGLDPDILVYPVLASVNDIVVTAFFVATVYMVLWGGPAFMLLVALFLSILGLACYLAYVNRESRSFQDSIREGAVVVVASSLFGSVNGVFLSNIEATLRTAPGLMVLYPALTNALGNIGSIIGSTTTTRMALGYARSFREELEDAAASILQVEAPAALMHVVFAVISYLLAGPSTPGASLGFLLGVALISNLSSFLVISVVALGVAFLAFQRGLNPDNVVIPAITSVSDTAATIAITPAVTLARALGL